MAQGCPGRAELRRWMTGADDASVEAHIETCADCQAALDEMLRAPPAGPGVDASWNSAETFLDRLQDRSLTPVGPAGRAVCAAPPALDGYELLEELGRGGM